MLRTKNMGFSFYVRAEVLSGIGPDVSWNTRGGPDGTALSKPKWFQEIASPAIKKSVRLTSNIVRVTYNSLVILKSGNNTMVIVSRLDDMAFRGAVALSNAGASLLSHGSIETSAMPALADALAILQHLSMSSVESDNATSTQSLSNDQQNCIDAAILQAIESKVKETNRHLSANAKLQCVEIPMSKLDCSSISSMIAFSQHSLDLFLTSDCENIVEMRPIRMSECCSEQLTSTMQTDLVSAVMLYNFAYGFLILGNSEANQPSLSGNLVVSALAKNMLQTSRGMFQLSMNILRRYVHVFQHPHGNGNFSKGEDAIESLALLLFLWVSVLISDYQAALILFLSSEEARAFEDEYFQTHGVFLRRIADKLQTTLKYLHGSDSRGKIMYHGGAAAA